MAPTWDVPVLLVFGVTSFFSPVAMIRQLLRGTDLPNIGYTGKTV